MEGTIFDLDGTLVETEQVWRDVRHDFVLAHGGRWHDGAQTVMMGMRSDEWARYMRDDLKVPLSPATIAEEVIALVVAALDDVPVLPGADAALERLSKAFRLALATSAALPVAHKVLARTGWERYFAAVVTADDVARGKPAPDVFRRAAELAGLDPAHAAGIEDSTNGIKSAHAAGLAVVAIPNREFPPAEDALRLATRVVANLDGLDVTLVRAAIARTA